MKSVVASKSESKYKNDNTAFILWICDNQYLRDVFLQYWFVPQLIEKEAIDIKTKGRKNMRAIYNLALDGKSKIDINSPNILQKITFNLFLHSLTKRHNKVIGFLSKASCSGLRSAFVHMYCMSGETMSEVFKIDFSQFMSGMKRMVASQKDDSGESLDEGNKSMRYEVYKNLCGFPILGRG